MFIRPHLWQNPESVQQNPKFKSVHPLGRQIWCGLAVLLLCAAVRWPHLNQSLWYDEMTTLVDYVLQPWSKVLAARAGEYVPNNHVFHTLLAKVIYSTGGDPQSLPPREMLLRMPAFIAGLLVPFALAWPLRRSHPLMALVLAVVTGLHPWLVAFSVEARGYSLMLLLGIWATNCLPAFGLSDAGLPIREFASGGKWRVIGYVILIVLAIYTVPLAIVLIPAHAVTVFVLNRAAFRKWFITAAVAVLLTCLLYLPMIHGLISYYRNPYGTTMNYRQFLDNLPRFAFAGMRLPQHSNPLWRGAESASAAIYWALPVIAIVIGSVMGWARIALRPMLITMGVATSLGILLPLVLHGATEVRFVPWIMPWFCLAIVAILMSAGTRWGQTAAVLGFISLISWQLVQDVTMPSNQPIREGFSQADQLVPAGRDIMVLYIGARESIALYGDQARHHQLLPAPNVDDMHAVQQRAFEETGHLPWVMIFFEELAFDRDQMPGDARGLWRTLAANYHLATPRLPSRLSPVGIYAPNRP